MTSTRFHTWFTHTFPNLFIPPVLLLYTADARDHALLRAQLTQRVLCQEPNGDVPCGQCRSCHLLTVNNHPDYIAVVPPNSEQKNIPVDAIRSLPERVYSTHMAKNKVIVVDPADAMTVSAMNALLKMLEEAPAHTYFILLTARGHLIVPTIRSRCQFFTVPALQDKTAEESSTHAQRQKDWEQLCRSDECALDLAERWKGYAVLDNMRWIALQLVTDIRDAARHNTLNQHHHPYFALWNIIQRAQYHIEYGHNLNPYLLLESILIHYEENCLPIQSCSSEQQ